MKEFGMGALVGLAIWLVFSVMSINAHLSQINRNINHLTEVMTSEVLDVDVIENETYNTILLEISEETGIEYDSVVVKTSPKEVVRRYLLNQEYYDDLTLEINNH